jgi:hypothetical protein
MYQSGKTTTFWDSLLLVLSSAAKLTAVWAGSLGLVLQFTGHRISMLRVSVLTCPLFFVVAVLATLSTCGGRLRGGHYGLTEGDNGLARQEEDQDVDTGDVLSHPVSKGFVEMVSILFT